MCSHLLAVPTIGDTRESVCAATYWQSLRLTIPGSLYVQPLIGSPYDWRYLGVCMCSHLLAVPTIGDSWESVCAATYWQSLQFFVDFCNDWLINLARAPS